jgi:predicted small integral membrane protein
MENTSDSTASLFGWMAWTPEVAIFFIGIGLMLAGMTVWQIRSPSIERKGFLPMPTTRGDRLFIGLLTAAYVNLAWAGFTEMQQAIGVAISFVILLVVMRWG